MEERTSHTLPNFGPMDAAMDTYYAHQATHCFDDDYGDCGAARQLFKAAMNFAPWCTVPCTDCGKKRWKIYNKTATICLSCSDKRMNRAVRGVHVALEASVAPKPEL